MPYCHLSSSFPFSFLLTSLQLSSMELHYLHGTVLDAIDKRHLIMGRPFFWGGGRQFFFFWIYIYFFICSEFCHTLKLKGLGFTCLPHPDPPSHLPPHPLPPGPPRAPGPSAWGRPFLRKVFRKQK